MNRTVRCSNSTASAFTSGTWSSSSYPWHILWVQFNYWRRFLLPPLAWPLRALVSSIIPIFFNSQTIILRLEWGKGASFFSSDDSALNTKNLVLLALPWNRLRNISIWFLIDTQITNRAGLDHQPSQWWKRVLYSLPFQPVLQLWHYFSGLR